MGVNKYAVQAAEDAEKRARAREYARIGEQAAAVIDAWHALLKKEQFVFLWPTLGAAIAAGKPWLTFFCPGCQVRGEVDLRRLDRHPAASVECLIPALSCRRCQPQPPHARLTGLSATRPHVTFWASDPPAETSA